MSLFHWLHHLLNPHCRECEVASIESKVCESCETLKMQLAIANAEKKQMLESILAFTRPAEAPVPFPVTEMKEVHPQAMTWAVRRQLLEAEDRKKAQVLREQASHTDQRKNLADSIAKLEAEVGIQEGEKSA